MNWLKKVCPFCLLQNSDADSFHSKLTPLNLTTLEKMRHILDHRCIVGGGEQIFLLALGVSLSWIFFTVLLLHQFGKLLQDPLLTALNQFPKWGTSPPICLWSFLAIAVNMVAEGPNSSLFYCCNALPLFPRYLCRSLRFTFGMGRCPCAGENWRILS